MIKIFSILLLFSVLMFAGVTFKEPIRRAMAPKAVYVETEVVKSQPVVVIPRADRPSSNTTEVLEVINLTEKNMVVMDQTFTDESVSAVMVEMQRLSENLAPGATLYLVLNTPGGSVDAGIRLISFAKALHVQVKTLTLFAASMGFQTAQQLGERLILDTGTLMSHRATFGVQGEAPGELFSRIKYIMSMIDALDVIASRRMNLTFDDYRKLVADEYWVYGRNAVVDRAADRMVLAKCGQGLNRTRTTTVSTIFGDFRVQVSKCPLIPGLLGVEALGSAKAEGLNYVRAMYNNRTSFVNSYIKTNHWMRYQK